MPESRKSLEALKSAIRQKRAEMGLPQEGPIKTNELLEALKKKPPVKELVQYVKTSLDSGKDQIKPIRGPIPPFRSKFDKTV